MDTPGLSVGGGPEKRKISPEEKQAGESKIEEPIVPTPEIQVELPATIPGTEVKEEAGPPQTAVLEEPKAIQKSSTEVPLDLSDVGDAPLNTTGQAAALQREVIDASNQ